MTVRGCPASDALTALRVALGQTAEALAHPRLDTLLASEAGLAAALAVLPVQPGDGVRDRALLRDELGRIRASLSRCRRLGDSLSGLLGLSLGDRGAVRDYGRDGRPSGHARPSTAGALEARG